jgi:hypothetical protein
MVALQVQQALLNCIKVILCFFNEVTQDSLLLFRHHGGLFPLVLVCGARKSVRYVV